MSYQPIKLVSTKRPFTPRERVTDRFSLREFSENWGRKSSANKKQQLPISSSAATNKLPDVFQSSSRRSSAGEKTGGDEVKLPAILSKERSGSSSSNSSSSRYFFRTPSDDIPEVVASESGRSNKKVSEEQVEPEDRLQEFLWPLTCDGTSTPSEDDVLRQLGLLRDYLSSQHKNLSSSNRRSVVEALLPILQQESPPLLVASLEVLFALLNLASPSSSKPSTTTFPLASKVFFHLSSDDANDKILLDHLVVDKFVLALAKSCTTADGESLLYVYGAFKFLTFNPLVLERLSVLGFFDLLILHLKIMSSGESKQQPGSANVVFQATSCLRNVINSPEGRLSFKALDGSQLLIQMAKAYLHDVPVTSNLARIYSALSMDSAAGVTRDSSLESADTVDNILCMIEMHSSKPDLVLRNAFALGNIAAASHDSRMLIFAHSATLPILSDVLENYLDSLMSDENLSDKKEDTVIKVIRIVANLSITAEVGKCLATDGRLMSSVLRILREAEAVEAEDMLLSALSAACNLSYYPVLFHHDLCRHAGRLVFHRDLETATEAARLLGNLSRRKDVRSILLCDFSWRRLYKAIKQLESREFVFSAVGVLVNMMTDTAFKMDFLKQRGLEEVCLTLLRSPFSDWVINSLACQLLWNLFNDFPEAQRLIGVAQFEELEALLVLLVDREQSELEEAEDAGDQQTKSQFLGVALHLLNKVFTVNGNAEK